MKIVVTDKSHSSLFKAFFALELDNGGVNRIEGTPIAFKVPASLSDLVDKADKALAKLSDDDMETFVCGEASEAQDIRDKHPDLEEANTLLDALFDGHIRRAAA